MVLNNILLHLNYGCLQTDKLLMPQSKTKAEFQDWHVLEGRIAQPCFYIGLNYLKYAGTTIDGDAHKKIFINSNQFFLHISFRIKFIQNYP